MPSSDYKETEKRYAGFVEWNFQAGNFAGNVGVRYEKMKMKYADFLNPEQSFDRDFDNVFPSVSLSHQMGAWANSLSFATRTSRPSFRQLSNSTYYQNEFFYQQGNPLLKPATSYNIQWGTSYQFLYFSLGYTRTKDYLEDTFENVQEAVISTFANFKKHQVLNADLNLQYAFGLWSPSLYLGVAKPFFEVDYLGEKIKYNQPQYTIVTSHDFSFPKVSPLLGPVKMSVTMVQAGTQHNVIPDRCAFVVDVRSNECYTNQELFDEITRHLSCQAQARSFRLGSSHVSPERAVQLGRVPFGSPTLSDQALMPFPSLKMGPGKSSRSHTADEFVFVREIEEAIGLYLELLDGTSIGQ